MYLTHRYSDNIYHQKIAILGPMPPPYGGIAVHIERVTQKFTEQNNQVFHFDTTKNYQSYLSYLFDLLIFFLKKRPTFIYYHTPYGNFCGEMGIILFYKITFRALVTIIDHDCRYLYHKSKFSLLLFETLIHFANQIIAIGDLTHESYKTKLTRIPNNYTIESPFIPPNTRNEFLILQNYPKSLFKFINNHRYIILANAFQLHLINNKDLYGFDLCIKMLKYYIDQNFDVGLIFILSKIGDVEYYHYLLAELTQKKLTENVFLIPNNKIELWPLLKKVHLFVRPTRSDSFGISIAEALHFSIPSVASDVCKRPEGTILFETGNLDDFIKKCSFIFRH